MRTVRDDDGQLLLVLEESADSSLVRDADTGEKRRVPNDALEPVDGDVPLDAFATAIPADAHRVVTACHDDWLLGLLVALADHGPHSARELLDAHDVCESDLLGGVTELRAAGLLAEATVGGEPGYRLTDAGRRGVAALRE